MDDVARQAAMERCLQALVKATWEAALVLHQNNVERAYDAVRERVVDNYFLSGGHPR